EMIRTAGEDRLDRRVLLEPGDQRHALERRDHRHAVLERVHRPVLALAEPAHGSIRIERHHERAAQRARLGEVGDMAAMQDVEYAVGEDHRALDAFRPRRELAGRADLRFEGGRSRHRQETYSNSVTTRLTPLVVRATSVAASASAC